MNKETFIKEYNLTDKQFSGEEKINDSLSLGSVKSIPDGFNPNIAGDLYMSSVKSIPPGFNPSVGGYLDLMSVTDIPDGFNPTVGCYLDLSSITSIPDWFKPRVGGCLFLKSSNKYIGHKFSKNLWLTLKLTNKWIKND